MTIHGSRGTRGVWGSIIFHASILVILAGIALSKFASFEASVALTEGQTFDSTIDRYGVEKAGPWYSAPTERLRFRVARVEPDHQVNGALTVATLVEADMNGIAEPTPIYINHGLAVAGRRIHQGVKIGYSPLVVVETTDGRQLLNGFTRLATHAIGGREVFKDFIEIPQEALRIELEYLPGAVHHNQVPSPRSGAEKGHFLHLSILQHEVVIFDQLISLGRSASSGGLIAHFADVRRWSQLDISDDAGLPMLILGSILATIGLALRLLCVRRRVVVALSRSDGGIAINIQGTTEKYHKTFEEELASLRLSVSDLLRQMSHSWMPLADEGVFRYPENNDQHKGEETIEEERFALEEET